MTTSAHKLKSIWMVALVATIWSFPAAAQGRLSLAERVARLEAQSQGSGSGNTAVELLQRVNDLQQEVAALRGLVEQQAFEIENLKRRQREQYLDLDTRLSRAEGRPVASGSGTATESPYGPGVEELPADTGTTSTGDGNQLQMEEPEVRTGVDGQAETTGLGQDPALDTRVMIDPAQEKAAYDEAFDALKDGRYAEAARKFSAFIEQYPNGEFAPNAHYWLGESYYVTQNYKIALDAFQQLLSRFPTSSKAGDALLKVGYCHYELKDYPAAEATLNQVVQQYPDSTVARLAQSRLRALKLEGR